MKVLMHLVKTHRILAAYAMLDASGALTLKPTIAQIYIRKEAFGLNTPPPTITLDITWEPSNAS